jgi:hypothetical protein
MSTAKAGRAQAIKAARARKDELQAKILEAREKKNEMTLSIASDGKVPEIKEREFDIRRALTGHYNSVQAVDWCGDSQRLVSCSQAGNVVVWDGMLGRKLNRVRFDMK